MPPLKPQPRWYHLTPDRFVIGLLVVEVLLLLSGHFQWFPFNEHKGWTVLIGVAVHGVAILVLLVWFGLALLLRRGFRFGLRTLMLLVVVCAVVCSWFALKMNQARKQREAVEVIQKWRAWVDYDYEYDKSGTWIANAQPATPTWMRKLLGEDFFHNAVKVGIDPTQVSDEAVQKFQQALPDCAVVHTVYPSPWDAVRVPGALPWP